jgi:hypothetical protein
VGEGSQKTTMIFDHDSRDCIDLLDEDRVVDNQHKPIMKGFSQ